MTPTNHDDLSNDLGRALHDRADGMIGSPLTLSDVKGRATRIRRRRAMATAAGAAAAIAIIVPTAIVGSDMFDSSSSDAPPATQDATPNPTETGGDSQSWPQSLDPTGLELGEAPGITWFEGTTMHTPEGDIELPADYAGVSRYDDGYIALDYSEGTVVWLDATGAVVDSAPSQSPIATSADGNHVLFVSAGTLTLHDNSTGEDTVIGTGHKTTEPVTVIDGVAYYNVGDWPQDGRIWDGSETDPSPGVSEPLNGAAPDGSTVGYSSIDDFGSCSVLRGPDGAPLGETCDFTVEEFSPDGEHLILAPSYRDGFGDSELGVFPAEGAALENSEVLWHYLRSGDLDPTFLDAVWEDDEHLLTITFTSDGKSAMGTWQILRIGLDGSVENAVEPLEADMEAYPFGLS